MTTETTRIEKYEGLIVGAIVCATFWGGFAAGHYCISEPAHFTLPEYFKDVPCKQIYDSTDGRLSGWFLVKDQVYLSGYSGTCGDFFERLR